MKSKSHGVGGLLDGGARNVAEKVVVKHNRKMHFWML